MLDTIKDAGSAVWDGVTQHPVPVAIIGTGLAWMLLENRIKDVGRSDTMKRARRQYEETAEHTKEAVESAIDAAKESISGGIDAAREGVSDAAERVGDYARRGYETSRRTVGSVWDEHPLASGLAVLAAGVTIGMLLPATGREREMVGNEQSQRVRDAGSAVAKRGQRVVSAIGDAVKREVADVGSRGRSGSGGAGRRR